ncbi:TonB-dependent receptor, partial [bacterium]|nr:TonB-dependent receptor [bacterium]
LDGGQVFDLLRFDDLAGLSAERGIHTVLGVERWLSDQWHVTVEGYHKKFDDLIDQTIELVERPIASYLRGDPGRSTSYRVEDGLGFRRIPKPVNDLTGIALGVDFRLEKRVNDASDRWFGWLSYSLGKSTREQTFDDVRISYPYDFDRRHSLDFVLNYRVSSKWNIGITWRFGSGFPYTPALAVEPLLAEVQEDPNATSTTPTILTDPETGVVRFVPTFGGPENINSLRYPDYHRLDARITYSTKIFNSNWQFYADFINIYDRDNVLFYRSIVRTSVDRTLPESLQFTQVRAFEEPVYMYPFIPSIGLSVRF